MKIAVATDSGQVAPHFGRCPEFTVVEIKDGEVEGKERIENPGHRPGYLPKFFREKGVDSIFTGGMGRKAVSLFEGFGIEVVTGIEGEVDEVIEEYLEGGLDEEKNPCRPGAGKDYGLEKEE